MRQLLVYPVVSGNLNQPSDILYTAGFLPLNTAALKYDLDLYVPDPAEANAPRVAPIQADLHNLPPTTIIAADEDPLKSDGQAYATKLAAAGNKIDYRLFSGTTHEFFGMGAAVAKAKAAEQLAAAELVFSFQ